MKIKLTKKFAGFSKGKILEIGSMHASSIISRGFAEKVEDKKKAKKEVSDD